MRAINNILENTDKVIDLQVLVYVSTAAYRFSPAEIDHMIERAQARNAEEGVTGILLYNDGNILQYLEGPASGVSKIYEIIKADTLHYGIIELLREPISKRDFPEWSMAFCSLNKVILSQQTQFNERLSQRLDPSDIPMSSARMLITKLWNLGRHPSGY
jgi:hypothetical protein